MRIEAPIINVQRMAINAVYITLDSSIDINELDGTSDDILEYAAVKNKINKALINPAIARADLFFSSAPNNSLIAPISITVQTRYVSPCFIISYK